jgi:hypothetical protein
MATIKYTKEEYGWRSNLEEYVLRDNPHIPKGRFSIVRKKGYQYWVFMISKGKSRQKHLCPAVYDDNGASFDMAIKKLKTEFAVEKTQPMLSDYIDRRIRELRDEGLSLTNVEARSKKTTQDKIYHLNKFKEFIIQKSVALSKANSKAIRPIVEQYVTHLKNHYKQNTVKSHLSTIKQFFDDMMYIAEEENIVWVNHIDRSFASKRLSIRKPMRSVSNTGFTQERHSNAINICHTLMEAAWSSYIDHGKVESHPMYGNQRSCAVQFISYLQLVYGFRISEVLRCYTSEDIKKEHYRGAGGYSYLEKKLDVKEKTEGYFFIIYFKKKHGIVFVNSMIYVNQRYDRIPYVVRDPEKNGTKHEDYGYNIIDVCLEMFNNKSKYLISMDRNEYYDHFGNTFIGQAFKEMDIKKTHDLRDYMINFNLQVSKKSINDISRIVRNTVPVLERYYLHDNLSLSMDRTAALETSDLQITVNKAILNKSNADN